MLLIGSAGSRRAQLLREALARRGRRLAVVEWRELLAGDEAFERCLTPELARDHAWCKIETPGDDLSLDDLLIRHGARRGNAAELPAPLRHGELAHRQLRYAGLADVLARISRRLESMRPGSRLRLLNGVDDILTMCDKALCQRHLAAHGVAVPPMLGEVAGFEQFEAAWPAPDHPAVFIKARYGSSAAGVIALRRHRDGRLAAYSSARRDARGVWHNHLAVSAYRDRAEISALVDALARQGAYAEAWLAKPRAPVDRECSYDLRVVATAGRARQRIARLSRSPLTNLHLGNARAAPDWLDERETRELEEATARAARAFPSSHNIGFDIHVGVRGASVLEANAFGDLLPGLTIEGATTYDDQAELVSRDES